MPTRQAKRVVFKEKGKVEVENFEVRKPGKDEVLIKTKSTSISAGTELAILTGTHMGFTDRSIGYPPYPFYPFYPGYSNAGEIIDIGEGVSEFKIGDRVVSSNSHSSHVISSVDPSIIQKISLGVSYDQATIASLGLVSLNGLRMVKLTMGESVIIIGQGLVGQLALQLCKLAGAYPVIAVDLHDERLNVSRRCGADYTINPRQVDLKKELGKIVGGEVDIVIEATGNPKVIPLTLELANKLGRVLILSAPRGKVELDLYKYVVRKGLSLVGAHVNICPTKGNAQYSWTKRRNKEYILELISEGLLKVNELITHKVDFKEAPLIYRRLLSSPHNTLGVVLNWSTF